MERFGQSLVVIFSIIIGVGGTLYYFFNFSSVTYWAVWIALLVLGIPAIRRIPSAFPRAGRLWREHGALLALHGLLCAVSVVLLALSRTTESVLGPWAVAPQLFFVVFFLQSLVLLTAILRGAAVRIALASISLYAACALAVIPLLFPLGYGFDPAIHQQGEAIILREGVLEPKTPYYTGQYVLIAFLTKTLSLPVEALDRLLLPLFVILVVPASAFRSLLLLKSTERTALLGGLGITLALLPIIASPTPWGWASAFFVILTLGSIRNYYAADKYSSWPLLCAIAYATLLIHPLVGLPSCAILAISWISQRTGTHAALRRTTLALFTIGGSLLVPAAILTNALRAGLPVSLGPFRDGIDIFQTLPVWRFDALRDPLYAIAALLPLGAIILWSAWMWHAFKRGDEKLSSFARAHTFACLMLLLGFVAMRFFVRPDFLIDYEQGEYAYRLGVLLALMALPVIIASLSRVLEWCFSNTTPPPIRTGLLFALSGLLVGSVYLSYPRNDPYGSFHGYNLSAADLEAVEHIHTDARGEPYLVLSNQVTAAAAVKKYGFLRYVDYQTDGKTEKVFAYPIPTSSPLYQSFLSLMKNPEPEIVRDVMERSGVLRVYFVVHRYEPRSVPVAALAASFADSSHAIADTVTVLSYQRKN